LGGGSRGRLLALSLPVALAFADASIVLLALPELVARLHTSISHVIWVIVVYNLALIAGSLVIRFAPRMPPVEPMLIGGLLLFGAASLVAGLAGDLMTLLIARGFQGAGGAVLLCASLPPMARASAAVDASPLRTWSAAAAIGAAIGPAAGGVLTQLFDWRAIFLAQAPVAVVVAIVVWLIARDEPVHPRFADPTPADARTEGTALTGSTVAAIRANLALTLLSAGLIRRSAEPDAGGRRRGDRGRRRRRDPGAADEPVGDRLRRRAGAVGRRARGRVRGADRGRAVDRPDDARSRRQHDRVP
jgi:MFS family permease